MIDYIKLLPQHEETYVGENDLFLEKYEFDRCKNTPHCYSCMVPLQGAGCGVSIFLIFLTRNGIVT